MCVLGLLLCLWQQNKPQHFWFEAMHMPPSRAASTAAEQALAGPYGSLFDSLTFRLDQRPAAAGSSATSADHACRKANMTAPDKQLRQVGAHAYFKGRQYGMQNGERKGYEKGHHVGYEKGCDDGFDKGFLQGFEEGYWNGRADEKLLRKRKKSSHHEASRLGRPLDHYGNPKPDTDPDSDPDDPLVTTSEWWLSDDETTMPLSQISKCPQPDGPGSLGWWWPERRPRGWAGIRRRRSNEAPNIDETNVAGSSISSGQKRVHFDDAKRVRLKKKK